MINATITMYNIALGIMGVLLLCCLVRAIMGPRIADRIIAINMMGTLVVMIICISTLMNDTIMTPADMEKNVGLTVLGSIPLEEKELNSVKKSKKSKKRKKSSRK